MAAPSILDLANRSAGMADKPKKWVPKKDFHPAGSKGKLHRELGIPEGQTIPSGRLRQATRSRNPEIRRDAIRAETMKGWNHKRRKALYDHPRSSHG
jgi:hypothetical protein